MFLCIVKKTRKFKPKSEAGSSIVQHFELRHSFQVLGVNRSLELSFFFGRLQTIIVTVTNEFFKLILLLNIGS